jgi:type VI secretion system lysozyme-like protein
MLFLQEPKKINGGRKLLFDRLTNDSNNFSSTTVLDFEQLVTSITTEVEKILSTRFNVKLKDYDKLAKNYSNFALPNMFGIADFNDLDPTNKLQSLKIAKICENAITAFEPRLKNIKVLVKNFVPKQQQLNIYIKGKVMFQHLQQEINFPCIINF